MTGADPIEVLLLTERDCAYCEKAREVINRLSSEYGLVLETLDIGSPRGRALAADSGIIFAPGVFIDGETFSYGRLSERRLRKGLDRRLRSARQAVDGEDA